MKIELPIAHAASHTPHHQGRTSLHEGSLLVVPRVFGFPLGRKKSPAKAGLKPVLRTDS
jgi:hypothetical protein